MFSASRTCRKVHFKRKKQLYMFNAWSLTASAASISLNAGSAAHVTRSTFHLHKNKTEKSLKYVAQLPADCSDDALFFLLLKEFSEMVT